MLDHRGHRPLDGRHRLRLSASHHRTTAAHHPARRGRAQRGPTDHDFHRTQEQHMKRSKAYARAPSRSTRTPCTPPPGRPPRQGRPTRTKFDATVEVAFRLGVDPRKADQMVRGTVNLPHGTGKTARVLVFANGEKAEEARAAGADVVGGDELIEKVAAGWTRLRRRRRDPGPDGQGRPARQGARPARPHAQPEDRHRHAGRRQGRLRHQGRQDRVPRRQARQPALRHRQGVVLRRAARRELRRGARRGPAAQAVGRQGPLPQEGHRHHDDGPRHPGRPQPHPQPARPTTSGPA